MDALNAILRRYAAGAWRRRWLALGLAWGFCIVGWVAVMAIPPKYESSAEIYVAADPVLTPLLKGIAIGGATESEVNLLRRTLLSRPNINTLLDKTGLGLTVSDTAARQKLVDELTKKIKITVDSDQLFTITYRNPSPELAFRIVQTMVDIYMTRASQSNLSDMANARHFLDQQIRDFHDRLQETEKRRARFLSKYLQLLPGANGVSQFEAMTSQVAQLQGQLQDAVGRRQMLEQQLKRTPAMLSSEQVGPGKNNISSVNQALIAAQQKLAELRTQYTDSYPGVIATKRLVKRLEAEANGKQPDDAAPASVINEAVPNPLYGQLKVQFINTDATIASLKRQLESATHDMNRLEAIARKQPGLQAEFVNLDRNYGVLKKTYQQLLNRREAISIGSAANIDANRVQLEVVNPPQVPQNPVAPPRTLLFSAVLILGLGFGAFVVFLLAYADRSFYTIQDLREIGLPVIGGISLGSVALHRPSAFSALMFGLIVILLVAAFGGILFGAKIGVGLAGKLAARFA